MAGRSAMIHASSLPSLSATSSSSALWSAWPSSRERRSEAHKRLMLAATISLLTAAVARFLGQVGMGGPANLFFGTDVFVLVLVLYDLASRGRVHAATLWGGALVVGFKPLLYYVLSGTPAWLTLADA